MSITCVTASFDELAERNGHLAPYISNLGELVIPLGADPALCWWRGGRSLLETLLALEAPIPLVRRHLDPERLDWFEERAAILEHDGGLARDQAEHEALRQLAENSRRKT